MYLLCTQVFTRLNHLNITLSYKAVLQIVSEIGECHLIPLQRWLEAGECVQFIGDNVDKRKSVRDVKSDSQAKLHHMYSMIAVKARIPPPTVDRFTPIDLEKIPISTFLPSISDIQSLRRNLVILISRILWKYIKGLACISDVVPKHILQRCAKRHIMDGDTAKERLDYLEPKIEDWHALQTFLTVR